MELLAYIIIAALGITLLRLRARVAGLEWKQKQLTERLDEALNRSLRPVAGAPEMATEKEAVAEAAPAGPWAAKAGKSDSDTPEPQRASAKPEPAREPAIVAPEPAIAAAVSADVATASAAARSDMETSLGTRWAVWVGGIALALGGLFLVRYSIEAGWFGPGARLTMGAIFGLVLLAGGEYIRRTGAKVPLEGLDSAYVPGILTAAGAFTLFGVIYAAHSVYGFIGPGMAFALLGMVALATIALALLHGLPLAGLGLLGALLTPMLVASNEPNAWALFVYLAIVLAAAVSVARIRSWDFLASGAFIGVGLWILLYMSSGIVDPTALLFISAVMVGVLVFLWEYAPDTDVLWDFAGKTPHIAVTFFIGIAALWVTRFGGPWNLYVGVAIVALLVAAAALSNGSIALLFGAGIAACLVLAPQIETIWLPEVDGALAYAAIASASRTAGVILSLLFLGLGLWKARQAQPGMPVRSAIWIAWAAAVPLAVVGGLWWRFGNPNIDFTVAAVSLGLAVLLAAAGNWLANAEDPKQAGGPAISAALVGSGLAFGMAIHAGFGPLWTTILVGASAVLPALATRFRSWPVLGWLAVGAFAVTFLRAVETPTIVDPFALLNARPVFNVLLAGYGIPALAFAFAAWQLARTTDGRPRLVMEVAAVLFALLTIAMLVRHAMTGGNMYAEVLTLAEQSIYTLLALGMGASLIAIGQRAPSQVMTLGSMALGCLSAGLIVLLHFFVLNPLVTDESTGRITFFNLLFLAYLLPAIAAGAVALYSRGKRPKWYAAMLGLISAALGFTWLTLSVRRWYQGEFIGWWRTTTQLETYTYSAVWLAFGVLLLVVGVRLKSYVLRVASAVLIALSVLKVFILDMSALEGVLRALSFIGLGAILIGIGLFYQRLLVRERVSEEAGQVAEASDTSS